jgi:hypothetical protein
MPMSFHRTCLRTLLWKTLTAKLVNDCKLDRATYFEKTCDICIFERDFKCLMS